VTRATMRFVETKTSEQQSLMLHHAPALHPPANLSDQRDPRPSGRVRDRSPGGAQGCRATACGRHGYE
jgi:hypothetical protein